ncbi:MAG: HAD family hydrolase [Candidatus Bathyarchaeota archaeon]|nr:HAD family hydrolase [Candidatus Bathyarchaeota archaeon]
MQTKAVVTDYIGTLVNARNYSIEASRRTLHKALVNAGLKTEYAKFLEAYTRAHEKYRIIRYEQFREVTNAVWVCEALNDAGCKTSMDDPRVKTALNVFFMDYVDSLELRPYAKKLLQKIKAQYKLGLISNFTYAPVVYASLRKLRINQFFDVIVVSEENGWRKPHIQIFQDALGKLHVHPEEAVFIGDSPLEDIKGAREIGMKTVFVISQFYTLKDLQDSGEKPNFIARDLRQVYDNFEEIMNEL